MALFEFFCKACKFKFEQIVRPSDSNPGECPKCLSSKNTEKLISRFAVGGQGDLRETTVHGCHSYDGTASDGGHTHGPGCGHGGSPEGGSSSSE